MQTSQPSSIFSETRDFPVSDDPTAVRALRAAALVTRVTHLISSNQTSFQILANLYSLLAQVMQLDRMIVIELAPFDTERVSIFPVPPTDDPARTERYIELARAFAAARERSGYAPQLAAPDSVETSSDSSVQPGYSITAPLMSQGNMNGALIVETFAPAKPLTAEDAAILGDIALQVALHLERERALVEARRRMDQMAAFSAVSSTVNEWVDVEQLARRFLSVFLNSTATNYGLFYLIQEDDQLLMVAQYGVPTELHESFRVGSLTLHRELQRVMAQGHIVVLQDIQSADISEAARELAGLIPVNAVALVPLRVKGRGIGFVALGKNKGEISIADGEFVQGLADQAAQAVENARLIAESQRRFEEQSALRELAQSFLSAVSPEEVLERTLEALTTLLPGDFYEILLPDPDGGFVLAHGRGWRRGTVGRTRTVSDPHLYAGYVLRAQSPIIIEDFAAENRFQPADYMRRHSVKAGVCAPMLAERRMIGLVGVYSREPRQFSEEQSHFLYLVATQTAMALEKARHSQESNRRLEELKLLNDVIVAANSEVSFDRVLENVTAEIGAHWQSDAVRVYFVNPTESAADPEATLAPAMNAPASEWAHTLSVWVAHNKESLLIQDLGRDLRFTIAAGNLRTALAVPMMIGERVIGVIAVAHSEPNAFDSNDLRLLTTLGGQIAAAIERARLLDETAKRLAEITALFDFSNALRTATTENRLLRVIVRHAVQILRGVGSSLQLVLPDAAQLQVAAVENMKHLGAVFPEARGGLSWEAYWTGEAFAVSDVERDARVRMPAVFEGMHGGIFAPLRTPSGVMGTLFVGFAERTSPGQDKLRLAATISNLAAQALQRLRLNDKTQEQAESLANALRELEESYQATLLALSAALDARDRETEGHSQRVTKWALAIGHKLNLSQAELTNLERGALLHDVGKIGISDNILLKAGPLTPEERALMNQHPRMGYDMLKGIPFLREALPVVLYHQEMYDGTGYPEGLRGEEIPLSARIFAVADAYDAMTSKRPYRDAMSREAALREVMRCRGSQFDPRVVDAFLELFGIPSG